LPWPFGNLPSPAPHDLPRIQVSPDFQYIRNPGFNSDRGPVRFWALRGHIEY